MTTIAPNDFVHLHTHSEFSLLDGLGRITDLVDTSIKHGFDSLAVTDHGALYGSVAFYQAATKAGIKPILGVETYVARRTMADRDPRADSQPFHMILLATDLVGYRNLCRLLTDAHIDGFYYKPRIDREHLARYSQGLVGLSACLGGEIPKALEAGDWDLARTVAGEYGDILGKDRFFLELQDHGIPEQKRLNEQLRQARARGRAAAGRHQRPALRPPGAARRARRPAVRGHGEQRRHAEPDEVRDARLLPQDRGRDGGAVPGPARRDPEHAPDRRHVRPRAAARRAADPAFPGARWRDRRDVAAQGMRGGPGPALRRHHAGAAGAPRLRAGRDHLDGLRRLLPDRRRLRALRPGAGDRDDLPGQRARLDRDLHPRDHPGRPHRLRPAVRAVPQPRPRDDARHRRRLRGRAAGRGHQLRQPQVRPGPRRPDHHVRHDAGPGGDPRRRARAGHGLRRGRPDRQGRPQPARDQARRGPGHVAAAQGDARHRPAGRRS